MAIAKEEEQRERLENWTDVFMSEKRRAGFVGLIYNDFRFTRYYGQKEASKLIKDTKGRQDRYITLNGFDVDFQNIKETGRKASSLKQIRSIGIDIDQYKLGMSVHDVLDHIHAMTISKEIPEPNMVLTSRGVQLFYAIDKGAAPKMEWLAVYITTQLIGKLKDVGADAQASDIARIMRVPDTINSRNGSRVEWEIWQEEAYTLQELQAYCQPLDKKRGRKKQRHASVTPLNHAISRFFSTNHARLRDLERLLDLRGGMENHRNTFVFVYAFHRSLVEFDLESLLQTMQKINRQLGLTENELKKTCKSAYKAAQDFHKHWIENGYKVVYKANDGIIKPYKNTKLVEKLEITIEEQRALNVLQSDAGVIKEKQRKRKEAEHRKKGIRPIEEYQASRRAQKAEKAAELRHAIESNPNATQRELAAILGVSQATVHKLIKSI